MFEVRVMPEAHEAIAVHALWWADHHSPEEALKWFDATFARIRSLAEMPKRNPMARESVKADEELRELLYGVGRKPTHRIVFQMKGQTVNVVTVRHVAQSDLI